MYGKDQRKKLRQDVGDITKKPSNFVDTIKPNKYIRDALLCEIKYLIPHIIISPVPLLHSSGIIHNMFTSNIIHWNNKTHLVDI